MKVLLDHCVNRRFWKLLSGHDVTHTAALGWEHLENGKLLDATENAGFEVIVTVDRNMRHQQNVARRHLSIITLESVGIDLKSLALLAPQLVQSLNNGIQPGQLLTISSP